MSDVYLQNTLLGKATPQPSSYQPSLLFPISRQVNRVELAFLDAESLPFDGIDVWNAYEITWLEAATGKPRVAMAEFYVPCRSEYLLESKSVKLYLNSLSQSAFKNETEVKMTLQRDLSAAAGAAVKVNLLLPPFHLDYSLRDFSGFCLDDLPVQVTMYSLNPDYLQAGSQSVEESLYSNLFRCNCPVTGQPDLASIFFQYQGKQVDHAGLLKYLISFRECTEFP